MSRHDPAPPPGPTPAAADPWGLDGPLAPSPETLPDRETLTLAAARCFRGRDGEVVLRHLRAITMGRTLGPSADDRQLRHLEGQRQLFAHLAQLIEAGRRGPLPAVTAGDSPPST